MLNFVERVDLESERIKTMEETIGKGLMMPNNGTNSGSRKIMHSSQIEHAMNLLHPEPALIQTGFENRFGEYASSFIQLDDDYEVVYNIPKFSLNKQHHYYLVVRNKTTDEYDILERISYDYVTESYGYLFDNKLIDYCSDPGKTIHKGDVIKKSTAYDQYNNRQDGINLLTAYIACEYSKEDSIELSESASKKLAVPLIRKVPITINDNYIPLNTYGDDNVYKCFPDIGEEINKGILLALRIEKKEESLYMQAVNRLKTIMMSDTKYMLEGKIIDINIYCNNPDNLLKSPYLEQIKYYYDDNIKFLSNFVYSVGQIIDKKCSYRLEQMYYDFKKILDGGQYIKDSPFSNIILEFIVLEESPVSVGDKISNRYGGKGVVSRIVPDEEMPLLDNGRRVEQILNPATMPNRENPGQSFETSANFISARLIDYMNTEIFDDGQCMKLYLDYLSMVDPVQAISMQEYIQNLDETSFKYLVDDIKRDGIILSLLPITEGMTIDLLYAIYKHFSMIRPYKVLSPITGSDGKIRFVRTKRDLIVGEQYTYRLKQYAEEKFSATSLSSTNTRNENSRNQDKKSFESIHSKTPIRFGTMESGDLTHLGVEKVIINLMINSASPHGRRLTEKLLTDDPFNIDIRLDDNAKNRGVEILNTYLKTIGLELRFDKIPKCVNPAMIRNAIEYSAMNYTSTLTNPIWFCSKDEYIDVSYLELAELYKRQAILFTPIEFF